MKNTMLIIANTVRKTKKKYGNITGNTTANTERNTGIKTRKIQQNGTQKNKKREE